MRGNISVDKAINNANWLIKKPMFLILVVVIILKSIYIDVVFEKSIDIFLTIFTGLCLCWLYWSFAIPIWKIWAYSNVRNVHELKSKAIKSGFIFKDGGFFEKTELKSFQQSETLKKLEKKFQLEDEYHDDLIVPIETKIYYSLIKLTIWLITLNCIIIGGIYLYITEIKSFSVIFLILFFVFFMILDIKNILNRNPQLIINEKGIQHKKNITLWVDIENEFVYDKWTAKLNHNKYLSFNDVDYIINDYDISMKELKKLLKVYRTRYEKNKTNL